MNSVPRNWVYAAAALLGVLALGSLVLGATRGNGHDPVAEIGPLNPIPNVAMAKPLADLTADEARMRQIAREEAQAILGRSAKPKAAPKVDEDAADAEPGAGDSGDSTSTAPAHTPAVPTAALAARPASSAATPRIVTPAATAPSRSSSPTGRSSGTTTNPYPPGSSPD